RCGSSQQALHFGAQGIAAGAYDIVIAGGIESMSRVPMGSARMGKEPHGEMFNQRFRDGLVGQGVAAELMAARWGITRERMDDYSVRSHALAARARDNGAFEREIVSVTTPKGIATLDETIRATTTASGLAQLKVSFESAELSARFPEIQWSITAGNSSQITD